MITKMITKKTEEHFLQLVKHFCYHYGFYFFKKKSFECLTIRILAKMDQNYYFWKTPKNITKKIQKTITKKITKSKKTEKMITKNRGKGYK